MGDEKKNLDWLGNHDWMVRSCCPSPTVSAWFEPRWLAMDGYIEGFSRHGHYDSAASQ